MCAYVKRGFDQEEPTAVSDAAMGDGIVLQSLCGSAEGHVAGKLACFKLQHHGHTLRTSVRAPVTDITDTAYANSTISHFCGALECNTDLATMQTEVGRLEIDMSLAQAQGWGAQRAPNATARWATAS